MWSLSARDIARSRRCARELGGRLVFIHGHRADAPLDGDEEAPDMLVGTSTMVTASPTATTTASQRIDWGHDNSDQLPCGLSHRVSDSGSAGPVAVEAQPCRLDRLSDFGRFALFRIVRPFLGR